MSTSCGHGQGPGPDDGADAHGATVATLVENHRRFLGFLERRLGDRELAEDLLQAAFVRGLEHPPVHLEGESVVRWFFKVLRHALVDARRRAATRGRRFQGGEVDIEALSAVPEAVEEACQCILQLADTLRPEYADALRRVDLEGSSVQSYAAQAGITANNASVRLHRARTALEERLRATCRTCAEHGCADCTCGSGSGRPPGEESPPIP